MDKIRCQQGDARETLLCRGQVYPSSAGSLDAQEVEDIAGVSPLYDKERQNSMTGNFCFEGI